VLACCCGLALSNAELTQLFTTASGTLTLGRAAYTGDITVTGNVTGHTGYATLSLQTQQGIINTATGATLAVANLAVQAGSGSGIAGDRRDAPGLHQPERRHPHQRRERRDAHQRRYPGWLIHPGQRHQLDGRG
jgi:hypothetical protein